MKTNKTKRATPAVLHEKESYVAAEPGEVFFAHYYPTKGDIPGTSVGLMDIINGTETQIYARTYKEAEKAAKERKLGEVIDSAGISDPPFLLASEWAEAGDWREAMHAACYLGFIAMKAGRCEIEELLGDGGIIHNLAHLNLKPSELNIQGEIVGRIKAALPKQLRNLESRVPGFTRATSIDMPEALRLNATKVRRVRAQQRRDKAKTEKVTAGLPPAGRDMLIRLLQAAEANAR